MQTFHPNFQGGWSTKAVPVGNGVGSDYDANWSWSPDNSQDDLHNGLFSIGTGRMNRADGVWVGSPTGPSPDSPMTYTVTDNQNPATATAKYVLTVHDQVEGLTHDVSRVDATSPFWGPDGHIIQVEGPHGKNDSNVPSVSSGSDSTTGYSGQAGVDINLPQWANLFGVNFGYSVDTSTTTTVSSNWPLDVDVPAGSYTYPVLIAHYNRHTFHWKHFVASGEHKLFDANHNYKLHQDVEDQYTGYTITYHAPVLDGTPTPTKIDAPTPVTPDPGG